MHSCSHCAYDLQFYQIGGCQRLSRQSFTRLRVSKRPCRHARRHDRHMVESDEVVGAAAFLRPRGRAEDALIARPAGWFEERHTRARRRRRRRLAAKAAHQRGGGQRCATSACKARPVVAGVGHGRCDVQRTRREKCSLGAVFHRRADHASDRVVSRHRPNAAGSAAKSCCIRQYSGRGLRRRRAEL